ncbi:hypothetical protein LCGC14_2617380 [marine sediment metagenome]|uniref:Uncharacterized protein n=1 Tax=marine sediment metagenome TaxID=412755 RepID=A0A0F8W0A3_9ZZZZ
MNSNISISGTISGSLRKFSKEISQVVMEFKKKGIKILSPIISEIINEGAQFIYFDHDKTKPIALIEQSHLKSIDHSDFLYVVCPNGYIGNSTLLEIGYAIAIKKKIYSSEPPEDLLLKKLIEYNKTIPEIIDSVVECKKEEKPLDPEKLPEIQKYIKLKVIERGFEHETETETVIEYQNVSVDRFVDVPTADISLYILPAVEDFLDELDDADDLECGNDEYSLSEVSIDRDYTHYPYSVTIDEDSDGDVTEVGFESRLEFDEDDEKSCKKHYEVLVTYEVGEDTEFEYWIWLLKLNNLFFYFFY